MLDHHVVDAVARLHDRDDLLVFLRGEDRRRALHIALGANRARVCVTRRRFPKAAFASGPLLDRLETTLRDTRYAGSTRVEGERRATLRFRRDDGTAVHLEVELFGNRGLWCLREDGGRVLEMSRLPNFRDRTVKPGHAYEPPASPGTPPAAPPSRFGSPCVEEIDRHFSCADEDEESTRERDALRHISERALQRGQAKIEGLKTQRESMERAHEIRERADLLLAYGYGLAPGATELRAPSPSGDAEEVVIPLQPGVSIHAQADKLYQKARKYEDGREHADRRIQEAERQHAILRELRDRLDPDDPGVDTLREVREALQGLGLAPKPKAPTKPNRDKVSRQVEKEGFRRFESAEGLPIFVGRNNSQNDRLSIHFARGNDLWFHVGRGYAGSHVVVRLAKNQNASLETLLDAGTLAVHFSKIRGAELSEVIYTQAKNVSKPKGLPLGKVIATRTKSLRVRLESARLERLLGGDAQRSDR